MATKKETIEIVLNTIEYVCNVGNMPIYNFILKNHKKGYKPAKDFVKKVAERIENKEFETKIDLINHLTTLPIGDIVPHTYSRYQKTEK
jgi:hypothetical protein